MLAEQYEVSGIKQRLISEFEYASRNWERERRVIARLEHGPQGANPRFVVTSLPGDAVELYERLYCARGEAENRIKEAQRDLFGRRASCRLFAANQLRLLMAALAYTLMINLRRLTLKGTELERACTATIRTKLLKIGAVVLRNTWVTQNRSQQPPHSLRHAGRGPAAPLQTRRPAHSRKIQASARAFRTGSALPSERAESPLSGWKRPILIERRHARPLPNDRPSR